jgi:hypothetical protein
LRGIATVVARSELRTGGVPAGVLEQAKFAIFFPAKQLHSCGAARVDYKGARREAAQAALQSSWSVKSVRV